MAWSRSLGAPKGRSGTPRDLDADWTYDRFPVGPWKRIRTTKVLERSLREGRRRVRGVAEDRVTLQHTVKELWGLKGDAR